MIKHATRALFGLALVAAIVAAPQHASASLIGMDVVVAFSEPGETDLIDVVTVGLGNEIFELDGTNIGDTIMLGGEFIDIQDHAIVYRVRGDGPDGTTGLPVGSQYLFSGLDWGPTFERIVGVTITLDNVTGVILGDDVTFTDNALTLLVDELVVGPVAGGPDLGTITLALEVMLPEPAATALFFLGLTGIALRRRGA